MIAQGPELLSVHITAEMARHFRIKVEAAASPKTLIVPLFNKSGALVGEVKERVLDHPCTALTLQAKFKSCESSCCNTLYHLDKITAERNWLIVTIGIAAVWKLWDYGFPDIIGVLCFNPSKSVLAQLGQVMSNSGVFWVFTDKDAKSVRCGQRLAALLSNRRFTRHVICTPHSILMSDFEVMQRLFVKPL